MHGNIYIDDAISDHSLNDGLVERWMVLPNHQRGVFFRGLRKKNRGTLTSSPTWSAMSPKGGYGSLQFAGNTNHVLVQSSSVLQPAYITLSVRVRLQSGGVKKNILTKIGPAFGAFSFLLESLASNLANAAFSTTTGTYIDVQSTTSITVGEWYCLATTWNGTTPKLYLNGIDSTGGSGGGGSGVLTYNGGAVYIADRPDLDGIEGNVSDVSIYNRALSATEIANLYQDQLRGSPETLKWYKRKAYSFIDAGGGGNRRRRVICGAA